MGENLGKLSNLWCTSALLKYAQCLWAYPNSVVVACGKKYMHMKDINLEAIINFIQIENHAYCIFLSLI